MSVRPILLLLPALLGLSLFLSSRVEIKVQPLTAEATTDVAELSESFIAIAEKVQPTVVSVDAVKVIPGYQSPFRGDPFLWELPEVFMVPERRVPSVGSGVIVSADGSIVTNHHVVQGVTEISVTFDDETRSPARLVGSDAASDLALLKVERQDLPVATWGDSDALRVGEWVLAFGSPYHMRGSVSHGIISGKGRKGLGIADFEDFLQTDAPINPGNSGGPLVNLKGEVVGINTAILSESGASAGISLAIPSQMARPLIDELIATGKVRRSWLGIFVQPVTRRAAARMGLPNGDGVVVMGGYNNGPAAKAGMQRFDVILSVNGKRLKNEQQLRSLLATTPVGEEIRLGVWRQGQQIEITLKTGTRGLDSRGRPHRGL